MTLELEQEESIGILQKIKVLPIGTNLKVSEEKNERLVTRSYHIDLNDSKYPTMNTITINYKVNKYTEKVKNYSVYLTNNVGDTVYLCKYSPKILNTLFNNIILLELSNWRRIVKGMKPLKTIEDYPSFKFELSIDNNKRLSHLKKIVERNTSKLVETFKEYTNTNKLIPAEIWQSLLI